MKSFCEKYEDYKFFLFQNIWKMQNLVVRERKNMFSLSGYLALLSNLMTWGRNVGFGNGPLWNCGQNLCFVMEVCRFGVEVLVSALKFIHLG